MVSWPRLERAGTVVQANQLIVESAGRLDVQGRTLADLRAAARNAAVTLAREYTHQLTGDAPAELSEGAPLLVTGHQPALFHPGVWAKNFAIAALAEQQGGGGLNLIVDNDLLASSAIAVPCGSREAPRRELFPLLDPQPPRPWEEALIDNRPLFETFGERVTQAVESAWGYRPLLADCWSDAMSARETFPRLADCLTAMRARQERRFGAGNLELPLSRIQESEPYHWFVCHLLVQAGRFREIHNEVLADYRRRNRVRNHAHPVPELRERDGWIETPFWVWRGGESQRQPLFVRSTGRRVELARGQAPIGELRLHPEAEATEGVADLAGLAQAGWKVRTRALTTTLFARLCLADLFIHGIGGAKYDEITNRILERFCGLTPPAFLTLTATLHLPLEPFPVTEDNLRMFQLRRRELDFNADRVLEGPDAGALHQARQEWIQAWQAQRRVMREANGANGDGHAIDRREQRAAQRRLHLELQQFQSRLRPLVAEEHAQVSRQIEMVERQLAANRVLQSREYAWCLFPEAPLQSLADRIRHNVG